MNVIERIKKRIKQHEPYTKKGSLFGPDYYTGMIQGYREAIEIIIKEERRETRETDQDNKTWEN